MKKYKIIISAIFVTLLSINTFMTTETFKDNTLSLNEVMSFAIAHAAELPDIDVICSSGTYGKCRILTIDECPLSMFDIFGRCEMTENTTPECYSYDEFDCF
jgi:hypothetical protein